MIHGLVSQAHSERKALRKHAYLNILKILLPKNEKKKSDKKL